MYIRRYYPRGSRYEISFTDDFFEEMVEKNGINYALEMDNANYEIIFENKEERDKYIRYSYERVLNNIRWYLDNLELIPTIGSKRVWDKNINCFTTSGAKVSNFG